MTQTVAAETWTVNALKAWAKKNRQLAINVIAARLFAEDERKRVDAYTNPIFAKYGFRDDQDHGGRFRFKPTGELLKHPNQLYRSKDEEGHLRFYAECIEANLAHGWAGNPESCPALTAEHNVVLAENALIEAANGMMGMDSEHVYGKNRDKLLDLLIGTCLVKQ